MKELRPFAALSGIFNRIYFIVGVSFIYLLLSLSSAQADDSGSLVPLSSTSTDTSSVLGTQSTQQQNSQSLGTLQQSETPTVTSVIQKIETATVTLNTAIESATAVLQTIPNVETVVATSAVATQVVDSATVAITAANTAIQTADSATATALIAQQAVDSQTVVVSTATTTLNTEKDELQAIKDTPLGAMTYTTAGYVAPVAPETPTITTTVLPGMGDAATQIQTPFDIKMGDTLFNGQGTNSQIYVSSKATISFGGPDWTYYNWPNMTQDGIYVFQSDYMSTGNGASITVTTTETTLSIDWILHRFGDYSGPLTNISWDMTVNPETGEWTGTGTMSGNTSVYGGPRTGVRQDNALTIIPTYTQSQKDAAVITQTGVVTSAQTNLTTQTGILTSLQETATATINTANTLANTALVKVNDAVVALNTAVTTIQNVATAPAPQPAPQPQPTPVVVVIPDYQPLPVEQPPLPVPDVTPVPDPVPEPEPIVEPEPQPTPEPEPVPEPEPESSPEPAPEPEPTPEPAPEPAPEPEVSPEPPSVESVVDDAMADGKLTDAEKELVAEALIAEADGKAVSAEAIKEAGLTYEDLPPTTPVEVRKDENGNEVIITAEVAAALVVLQNPSELIGAIFNDPGQVLLALGSIGADMSTEEREESQKIVVAAVIAGQAAIGAATMAATSAATGAATTAATSAAGNTGGGTTPTNSGGGAGGPAAGNDKPKRTFRRRIK